MKITEQDKRDIEIMLDGIHDAACHNGTSERSKLILMGKAWGISNLMAKCGTTELALKAGDIRTSINASLLNGGET